MSPASSSAGAIALVDCNNFYCSCERVFQPAWENRPLAVLSNNDGCIIARSQELKAAGIPMGAPYFQYRQPLAELGAVVVSSNYALYGDMSARVMATLAPFTPRLEIYSIDEAWLELGDVPGAELETSARAIVATVKRHTGIPVSVGVGPTKVLAKVANRVCKARGLPGQAWVLPRGPALDAVLDGVAVGDIWGIGQRWGARLQALGIATARQLRDADPPWIARRFGAVVTRIVFELRGIRCVADADDSAKQQIIASRSFGSRVSAKGPLLQAVASHAARAGEKLRRQGSLCGALQVFIHSSRHDEAPYAPSALVPFAVPTADTRRLVAAARAGVEQLYRPGPRYAKAGVMLLDLSPAERGQRGWLDDGDTPRSRALMALVDEVNRRYGRNALFFAGQGCGAQPWHLRRQRVTPRYTTCWGELPTVG